MKARHPECDECGRVFQDFNSYKIHQQNYHRPRDVPCPVCGEERFKSGAGAAQHFESGGCSGCHGQEQARRMAYNFVKSQAATQQFMVPQLTYCGDSDGGIPDTPYQCTNCYRQFREVSAMMQHMVFITRILH